MFRQVQKPLNQAASGACAGEDLNLHDPYGSQGPQPCASTNSATSASGRLSLQQEPEHDPVHGEEDRHQDRQPGQVPLHHRGAAVAELWPGLNMPDRPASLPECMSTSTISRGRAGSAAEREQKTAIAAQSTNTVPGAPSTRSPRPATRAAPRGRRGPPPAGRPTSAHRRRAAARPRQSGVERGVGAGQLEVRARAARHVPAPISSRTPGSSGTASNRSRACMPDAGGQLAGVPDQPEAGHVGDRVRRVLAAAPPRRRSFSVVIDRTAAATTSAVGLAALDRRGDDAGADPLAEHQHVAGAAARVASRSGRGGRSRSPPCRTWARDRRSSGRRRSPRPPRRPRRRRRAGSRPAAPSAASSGRRPRSARTRAVAPIA